MVSENHNIKPQNYNNWTNPIKNTLFVFIVVGIFSIFYLLYLSSNLPSINELNKYNPEQVSKIISSDDVVIKKLYIRKRDMIDISNIPQHLIDALLVMEDSIYLVRV